MRKKLEILDISPEHAPAATMSLETFPERGKCVADVVRPPVRSKPKLAATKQPIEPGCRHHPP